MNVRPKSPFSCVLTKAIPQGNLADVADMCIYIYLGWHVCRTKFARKIFFKARNFSRKMLRYFPRNVRAFSLWVRKIPAKFPPNFPPNFPPQNQKRKSPTSFCRSAGRISFIFFSGSGAGKREEASEQEARGFLRSHLRHQGCVTQQPASSRLLSLGQELAFS